MEISVIRSARKTMSLEITAAGDVVVRCPRRMPLREIARFVEEKRPWLERHLEKLARQPRLPVLTPEELRALAKQAARDLPERTAYFARLLNMTYGRITIRSQRTRWGSCSAAGNLNFNCLLMLTPGEIRDYVVVHELCHRKELNHSARFWNLVEEVLPDYRTRRQWLKDHGGSLIARLPEKEERS